jgi:hypothetical protein
MGLTTCEPYYVRQTSHSRYADTQSVQFWLVFYMGLTTTVRGGKYSITTTRVPVEMVSLASAA